ncbi:MAG: thioredoxin domain-containing protein [Elusimicrobiota bacterium]|nr:thioredoxin domain-containing protein [Elusimicrobiota bacterium]
MANLLAGEKSPYLLQHKDNPVHWRPWGEAAFAAAKKEDKPILLSIGYSTCHWCHVMERESFADPKVAEVMNRHFVCVKLDREERPDVDKVYMTAVQAMTGQGGWPLNAFLTPELKPFFGGTYFPPDSRWGRPGWPQLLERIAQLWRERRADVDGDARRMSEAVAGHLAAEGERAKPGREALAAAVAALKRAFDPVHGGFGDAPKFPMPSYQRLLLRLAARSDDEESAGMALSSLRAMGRGGVYDQVGGGLHRYSTDEQWRVPHFEKMLYDNAQLLENLGDALLYKPDAELRRLLERTVAYLERDLRHPEGGFYSAEDADSLPPGETDPHAKAEGAFYLWTPDEVADSLAGDSIAFNRRYGIVADGNALHDPHGEFTGRSIPYDADPTAMPEERAAPARERLRADRESRPRPSLDDKVLASWNGLAVTGLSRCFVATGETRLLRLADGAADFVRARLADESGRVLRHRWRDGDAAVPGMADDYAFMAQGLVDLYEAGFDPARLAWALDLAEEALARFAAPGGGAYLTAEGAAPELLARAIEDHDGVEPAPSSVLADACLRLHELTGREPLRRFADLTLERFGGRLGERPSALPYLACALDRALGPSRLVVIAGLELPGGTEMVKAVRAKLRPGLVVAGFTAKTMAATAALVPAVAGMELGEKARAFLCEDGACGLPTEKAAELFRRLDGR